MMYQRAPQSGYGRRSHQPPTGLLSPQPPTPQPQQPGAWAMPSAQEMQKRLQSGWEPLANTAQPTPQPQQDGGQWAGGGGPLGAMQPSGPIRMQGSDGQDMGPVDVNNGQMAVTPPWMNSTMQPPAPQPQQGAMPSWIDQNAVAADPMGFQKWQQGRSEWLNTQPQPQQAQPTPQPPSISKYPTTAAQWETQIGQPSGQPTLPAQPSPWAQGGFQSGFSMMPQQQSPMQQQWMQQQNGMIGQWHAQATQAAQNAANHARSGWMTR